MLQKLKNNIAEIRQRIETAAGNSHRDPESVRLIGVTKYVDAETTRAVVEAGCPEIGENRPQVLWDKAEQLDDLSIQWHMIGHLQRNKVKRTVALASLIHSVDSVRLLTAIDAAAGEQKLISNVLLEVNVSGETAKHGFQATELQSVLDEASTLQHVAVKGLMCMAGLAGNLDDARREFAQLREISESHRCDAGSNVQLNELSMGMSGDFEVAIQEGATLVRVGSLLFDGIN